MTAKSQMTDDGKICLSSVISPPSSPFIPLLTLHNTTGSLSPTLFSSGETTLLYASISTP
jgi:hypothetical protein